MTIEERINSYLWSLQRSSLSCREYGNNVTATSPVFEVGGQLATCQRVLLINAKYCSVHGESSRRTDREYLDLICFLSFNSLSHFFSWSRWVYLWIMRCILYSSIEYNAQLGHSYQDVVIHLAITLSFSSRFFVYICILCSSLDNCWRLCSGCVEH